MINSIELINWKTHGSTKLQFSKGTNLIIGQMGAGKSSIMDAISFGLFGTFPSIQQRRTNVSGLIRNKPSQQRKAVVKIEFTNNSDTYLVERSVSLDGPSSAKLEKNGAYLQSQSERVTEEIEKALKMDYDLFSKAVYSEQNGIDYFLNLRASDRKKQIDGFLGLDKFANSYESATSLINRLKEMAADDEKFSSSLDIKQVKEQLSVLEKEITESKVTIAKNKSAIQESKKEKTDIEKELKEMSKAYEKKLLLEKQSKELEGKVAALRSEMKKIDARRIGSVEEVSKRQKAADTDVARLSKEEKAAAEKLQEMQSQRAKLQSEQSKLKKDADENSKLVKEKGEKNIEEILKRLDTHSKELEKIIEDTASLKSSISERKKALEELKEHLGKCPVCETELDEGTRTKLVGKNEKLILDFSSKLTGLQEDEAKRRKDIEALKEVSKRLEIIEERIKSYKDTDTLLVSISKELGKAEAECDASKARSESARETLLKSKELLSTIAAEMESAKRREEYVSETERSSKTIEMMQKECASIAVDQKRLESLQSSLSEKSSRLSVLESEQVSHERYIADKEKQSNEKRKEIEKIEAMVSEIARKKSVAENMVKFRNSIQETQTVLRNRLVTSINSIMQEMWPQLYPYGDYTGIMLDATENDYLLKLRSMVDNKQEWAEVEAIASGGERSTASLAMRIAMSLVLVPNLKWLILDEPTHNIDQQGLSKFIELFNDALPKIIDQVFIITHDDALKQVSNARIYMLNRNKDEHEQTSAAEV